MYTLIFHHWWKHIGARSILVRSPYLKNIFLFLLTFSFLFWERNKHFYKITLIFINILFIQNPFHLIFLFGSLSLVVILTTIKIKEEDNRGLIRNFLRKKLNRMCGSVKVIKVQDWMVLNLFFTKTSMGYGYGRHNEGNE